MRDEGQLLIDTIDKLHMVIGDQPRISKNFGTEAKNRFDYVFIKFFRAICLAESPIALLVEDLQWMDSESHNFLSSFLTDNSLKNFIFIGTYRQNEIDDSHPVFKLMECIKQKDINTTMIKLDNLAHESLNDMISETLHMPPIKSYPLTALIHNATKGNPLFAKHMLELLYKQGSIFFCSDKNEWKWDNSIIEGNNMTEDILELMRKKILSFDDDIRYALKVASCMGQPFSLGMLKIATDCKGIEGSISTALIVEYKGNKTLYQFIHDNIQQAAYSLIDDADSFFWNIGTKLWTALPRDGLRKNSFIIANLFINSNSIIERQEDCSKFSDLFLQAGKKAMASTAFKHAFTYLKKGIDLLSTECWNVNYDLTLSLYDGAAKAAYCIRDFVEMNKLINEIQQNVSNMLHQLDSYLLQVRDHNDKGMHKDAIQVGLKYLDEIGVTTNLDECESFAVSEVKRAKEYISEKKNANFDKMTNTNSLAVMKILSSLLTSTFLSDRKLLSFVASKMVTLTFREGVSMYSCTGFCALGSVLCSTGDKLSIEFGKLALDLLHGDESKEMIPKLYMIYYITILPFYGSIHDCLEPLLEAVEISLEIGLHEEFHLNFSAYSALSFLCGKNLERILESIHEMECLFSKSHIMSSVHQALLNLTSEDMDKPAVLCGNEFDFERCFDGSAKDVINSRALVVCSVVSYLFYDYSAALKFVSTCRPIVHFIAGTYMYSIFIFYDCLISLACSGNEKENIKHIEENLLILKNLSLNSPQNYLNKSKLCSIFLKHVLFLLLIYRSHFHEQVHLIEAEMEVTQGNGSKAVSLYKQSILLSEKQGFLNEAAIAYENTGKLFQKSKPAFATKLLLNAYNSYMLWGAKAKLKHMVKEFPSFLKDETLGSLKEHKMGNVQVDNNSSNLSDLSEAPSTRSDGENRKKRVRF